MCNQAAVHLGGRYAYKALPLVEAQPAAPFHFPERAHALVPLAALRC